MNICKKVKLVNSYVQDWKKEYISSFSSVQEMAFRALEVAAVNAMADWLNDWICDMDERDLKDTFYNVSVDEFVDFFLKYDQTFIDIYYSWIGGNDPSSEDILSLRSYDEQTEDIFREMRYILDDIKRTLDDIKRNENSQKEVKQNGMDL